MIDEWGRAKYWDHAWNPMIGCEKVSEGCRNCYAERLADQYPELRDEKGGFSPHPPKHMKKPPKDGVVFVGNMTDLFGEWNTDTQILEWLHYLPCTGTYLVLTKRSDRLARLAPYWRGSEITPCSPHWFGVTAENQEKLEERAPNLIFSGSMKKWFSCEPLLGEMNITPFIGGHAYLCKCGWHETEHGLGTIGWNPSTKQWDSVYCYECRTFAKYGKAIQWVVVGAESGLTKVRRPCKLEWIESIVQQCQEAGVPVFVKQLDLNGKLVNDIGKFPAHLRIRQVPWKGR